MLHLRPASVTAALILLVVTSLEHNLFSSAVEANGLERTEELEDLLSARGAGYRSLRKRFVTRLATSPGLLADFSQAVDSHSLRGVLRGVLVARVRSSKSIDKALRTFHDTVRRATVSVPMKSQTGDSWELSSAELLSGGPCLAGTLSAAGSVGLREVLVKGADATLEQFSMDDAGALERLRERPWVFEGHALIVLAASGDPFSLKWIYQVLKDPIAYRWQRVAALEGLAALKTAEGVALLLEFVTWFRAADLRCAMKAVTILRNFKSKEADKALGRIHALGAASKEENARELGRLAARESRADKHD